MLTTADLASYTHDRLDADDPETQRLLDAGLATVRRYCGWHVTPEIDETLTLDGPGQSLLILPTLRLVALTELIEDGVQIDLSTLSVSARGLVRRRSVSSAGQVNGLGWTWLRCGHVVGGGYGWTDQFGGIEVSMTHGFAEAPDFDSAVLSFIDRSSLAGVSGGGREVVGPFQFGGGTTEAGSVFSGPECAILDLYRLEPSP